MREQFQTSVILEMSWDMAFSVVYDTGRRPGTSKAVMQRPARRKVTKSYSSLVEKSLDLFQPEVGGRTASPARVPADGKSPAIVRRHPYIGLIPTNGWSWARVPVSNTIQRRTAKCRLRNAPAVRSVLTMARGPTLISRAPGSSQRTSAGRTRPWVSSVRGAVTPRNQPREATHCRESLPSTRSKFASRGPAGNTSPCITERP